MKKTTEIQKANEVLNGTSEAMKQVRLAVGRQPKRTTKTMGFDTLPISILEAELDDAFGAMCWQTSGFTLNVLGGSGNSSSGSNMLAATASITLHVYHPVLNVWITRDGASGGTFSAKQATTFPGKLKAMAIKNAASGLGARFGRDLNRKEVDLSLNREIAVDVNAEFEKANTLPQLDKIVLSMDKAVQKFAETRQAYKNHKARIMAKKGGDNE